MKKILFTGLVAIGLASCSNDEVVVEQNDANVIHYSTTAQGTTRAENIYCPNILPESFTVSAKMGNSTYFDGDEVTKSGTSWQSANKHYWPASGSLDFFAHVNDGGKFVWDPTAAPTFTDYEVGTDVAAQQDLLYAVAAGQTKEQNSADNVKLNFRHALSQIVFRAKNTNPNLYVEVEGVSVVDINSKGTFTFPTESTSSNVAHGTASGTVPAAQGTWGTLTVPTTYSVDFASKPIVCIKGDASNTSNVVNLTEYAAAEDGSHADETDFSSAMLLLPQAGDKAVFTEGSGTLPTEGVYFSVKCKIWNVAVPAADGNKADSDILIYPKVDDQSASASAAAADVLIPVSINWQQGMKYIYTFVFGDGNGGWNPNGPEPVLVPITFDVDVDEFIPVSGQDINLDTND